MSIQRQLQRQFGWEKFFFIYTGVKRVKTQDEAICGQAGKNKEY